MKTDDLISMLSTNLEPVRSERVLLVLVAGLAVGVAVALCLMMGMFGAPAEAFRGEHFVLQASTLVFTLGLVIAGVRFLVKSARPGQSGRSSLVFIGLFFLVGVIAACVILAATSPTSWGAMLLGPQLSSCLLCIPLFALAPFVALIWAMRKGAPTKLVRSGAVMGLVAGALGATVFALQYPSASIPFVVLWYGGLIGLCAAVGALLGPRVLRW
jgi:hypothetical protein